MRRLLRAFFAHLRGNTGVLSGDFGVFALIFRREDTWFLGQVEIAVTPFK
jgi:hypothetical protein